MTLRMKGDINGAAEEFKNVQVLKRVPADQWFDTMAFIAGSLGVTCDHCHTSSFELDEGNPAKLKARQMMRMVDEINAGNFGGKNVITCNSCHRGALKPQAAPVPDADHWKKAAEKASTLPPAAELIARYRRAVGGADLHFGIGIMCGANQGIDAVSAAERNELFDDLDTGIDAGAGQILRDLRHLTLFGHGAHVLRGLGK